jgi:membrane protein
MLIYRALAAVPLFLLYIYGVAIIILLGAEITAVLQYKEHYLSVQNPLELEFSEKHSFYKMVELLFLVFLEQKKARKTITTEKLEKKLKIDSIEFINLLDKLIANKYVLVGKDKEIVPCLLPQDINLFDLYKLFFHESLEVPLEDKTILSQLLADKFHGLEEYLKRELENVNFLFLLEAYNSNKV